MQTLDALKRKIDSVTELESIVKTMKAMASVRIKQYEKAVDALRDYTRTVELGLQAVLIGRRAPMRAPEKGDPHAVGAVVFGSDQGMCGRLNDAVLTHALKTLEKEDAGTGARSRRIIAVGDRIRRKLENAGQSVETYIRVPASVGGITARVQEILSAVTKWEAENGPKRILLFYSRKPEKAGFSPHTQPLLPIDRKWVEGLREKSWPGRCLPLHTMDFAQLFSSLIRQYLFVLIFRAFAESMASENQSRLQAMQHAEKNIRDALDGLHADYHRRRQMSITEELLDIVSGFEALKTPSS